MPRPLQRRETEAWSRSDVSILQNSNLKFPGFSTLREHYTVFRITTFFYGLMTLSTHVNINHDRGLDGHADSKDDLLMSPHPALLLTMLTSVSKSKRTRPLAVSGPRACVPLRGKRTTTSFWEGAIDLA